MRLPRQSNKLHGSYFGNVADPIKKSINTRNTMSNNHHLRQELRKAKEIIDNALAAIDLPTPIYNKNQVIAAVCQEYEISEPDLLGVSKKGNLEEARPALCLLLFTHVSPNKSVVSKIMNRKSHSSSFDMLKRASDLLETSKAFKSHIERIKEKILLNQNNETISNVI